MRLGRKAAEAFRVLGGVPQRGIFDSEADKQSIQ